MIDKTDVIKLIDNCDDIDKTSMLSSNNFGLQFENKLYHMCTEYSLVFVPESVVLTDKSNHVILFKSIEQDIISDLLDIVKNRVEELVNEVADSKMQVTKDRLTEFLTRTK